MWGDVVFHYQTMQYSQSAGVLNDTCPIGEAFPSPLCNCEKMRQNCTHQTSWPIIGAANMAAHCLYIEKTNIFNKFLHICYHQYIGAADTVPPMYWWQQ
jgi:hypothetical protein